ncbi:MAG: GGDEF domain-containing protein [Chloroflexi bacterium]|nr:GGDEF domain-containing protein [Chloroflexota bacterium]
MPTPPPADRNHLEVQVLILQCSIAAFYCVGAGLGYFAAEPAARWASVAWVGGYHLFHAWYILFRRNRERPWELVEVITPALDVSCITVALLAHADPNSAFWAIYLYALVGYARRIHGLAYAALASFIVANLATSRLLLSPGSFSSAVDADFVTMIVVAVAMAALAAAIGTAWRNAERQARALAEVDPLTGLANRRHFFEWLDTFAADPDAQFAVLMLDLDDFKRLNDEHGHLFGDDVLTTVATLLARNTRAGDHVARYGGEEFVIALPGTGLREAHRIADRLREAIFGQAATTVSIGCAERAPGEDAESTIRRADDVLLAAKRNGKNTVRTAKPPRPVAA